MTLVRLSTAVRFSLSSAPEMAAPFSQMHIADASADKCRAAEQRLIRAGGSPTAYIGVAEQTAKDVVTRLNPSGLHFIFLDPFNLQALPFSVLKAF